MSDLTCGFIGLGLIGGSIARALKEYNHRIRIVAYDINPGTLRLAAQDGVVDVTAPAIDGSFSDCDYLFLCAPVQKNRGTAGRPSRICSFTRRSSSASPSRRSPRR